MASHSLGLGKLTWIAALLAIAGVAISLRVLYLGELRTYPDFDMPAVDAAYHDYWAEALVTGNWGAPGGQIISESPRIEQHPYFRPPGYPYFLAAVYRIFGHDHVAARQVQFALGVLSCLMLAGLGRRLFGAGVGLLAGLLMAVYWVFIYFEGELQPPVVAVFLALPATWAVVRALEEKSTTFAALAGILFGLATLTIPNFAAVVVMAGFYFLVIGRQERDARRGYSMAFALVFGAVLAIAPATVRNKIVGGEWVAISTNGGINLFAGNNPRADGHDLDVPGFGTSFDHLRVVRQAERETGHAMTHSDVSRFFADKALAYMRAEPGRCLALVARKAVFFWGGTEIFSNKELNTARAESGVLRRLPLDFAGIVSAALAGLFLIVLARRSGSAPRDVPIRDIPINERGVLFVVLLVVVYFVSYLPFFVVARYRVPIIPFLILLGARALAGVVVLARRGQWAPSVGITAAMILMQQLDSTHFFGVVPDPVFFHYMMGVSHARKNEFEAALSRYDQALAAHPGSVPTLEERAKVLVRLGRVDEAIGNLREATNSKPNDGPVALDLGNVLASAGRTDEAISVYREAVANGARDPRIGNAWGLLLAAGDRLDEAIARYGDALAIDPDFTPALLNQGVALGRLNRLDEAERNFRSVLRIDPQRASARANLEHVQQRRSAK